jgi:hypothetical protein
MIAPLQAKLVGVQIGQARDLHLERGSTVCRYRARSRPRRGAGMLRTNITSPSALGLHEKKAAAFVEFGPPNSRSQGLVRGGALANGGGGRFVALESGFPTSYQPRPAPTSMTSKLVRMVASVC